MARNVLIVDDSKLARMSVARTLLTIHADWTRVEAANADEALALVEGGGIDIALLDFNMPGRDGVELAVALRAVQPAMPVAIISANHQAEILARAHAAGATFLAKPLAAQALTDFLAAAERRLEPHAA